MPQTPFGKLPLDDVPYYSRVTEQYGTENKNYYIVGFNPGYALQASELNELQELFFLNQSLSNRMNGLWAAYGRIPTIWNGLVPVDPRSPLLTSDNTNLGSISITTPTYASSIGSFNLYMRPGWFYWVDTDSKLGFWTYIDKTITNKAYSTTVIASESGAASTYINYVGFVGTKKIITCCPSAECSGDKDATLRDNSSGSPETAYFTCGASRLQILFENDPVIRVNTSDPNFYPIYKIVVNTISQTVNVTFVDDQTVSTVG